MKRRLPILGQHPPSEEAAGSDGTPRTGRRTFLGQAGIVATGAVAAASVGCNSPKVEELLQQHYTRLTEEEKQDIFARIEQQTRDRYGVDVHVTDPPPVPGVEFTYALNLSLCIGCRRCEWACAQENNTSRDPEIHYIRVMELEAGALNTEETEHYYEGEVPRPGKIYMPVQCHQCANAPCTRACPVKATWREPDGIVVVDYNWCIGCRYCEAACPYFARRFNFAEPSIRPSEINPHQGYLSNRIRMAGVVEKCHFCLHRTRRGLMPACLEVCPVGARKFGNLLDRNSIVRKILEEKRVWIFKEELGTLPRFFYFFS